MPALQDAKTGKYYVFANEGDIYTDAGGSEYSFVTIIDTGNAEVISVATASQWALSQRIS